MLIPAFIRLLVYAEFYRVAILMLASAYFCIDNDSVWQSGVISLSQVLRSSGHAAAYLTTGPRCLENASVNSENGVGVKLREKKG